MRTFTWAGCLLTLLLIFPSAYGQDVKSDNSGEWMIPLGNARLDASARKKAKFLKDKERYADVEYVKLRPLDEAQQDGKLFFKVPTKNKKPQAQVRDIRAASKQNYEWNGTFDDWMGDMTVVTIDGKVRAQVSYDGEEYGIFPIEDDIHAVVRLLSPEGSTCGLDIVQESSTNGRSSREPIKPSSNPKESAREVGCAENSVRVLVLHTPRARATRNPQQEAQMGVNQFNQAEVNSQVAGTLGRLELAGVEPYTLPNGNERANDIIGDLNDLIGDRAAQDLRQDASADLVVLFTEGNYNNSNTFGAAGNFDPVTLELGLIDERSYAIVEIEDVSNNRTFAHEVGHLFAMRHQTCAEYFAIFNPACDDGGTLQHGYNFRKRRWPAGDLLYHTIMHQIRSGSSQIHYFSNPGVNFNGKATGQAGVADNARQLEIADFTVSRYELGGDLTASIDGPGSVNLYTNNTWESVHSCADNYTFQWETSDDGFNYYNAGTAETMSRSVYNSSQSRFYIRLTVTANGQTTTAFRTVYVNNARYEDSKQKDSTAWQEVVELAESGENGILLEEAYPNPLVDQTQLGFYLPTSNEVSLDILTLEGKQIRNIMGGATEAGSYEFTLEKGELPVGIYLYQLSVGENRYVKRLVVRE